MWQSHQHAEPTNAPLFYGPFASDPALYTERILEGFDAWMGVGQILTAPQLYQDGLVRDVYFPKSSLDDRSLYFDLHAPFNTHSAGEWSVVATPIEHGGLFAREGAVIPVGKDMATVTALSGPARRYADGVDVVLEKDGGQVGLDNWRGLMLFPGYDDRMHHGHWIEDDGISSNPATSTFDIRYHGTNDSVYVTINVQNDGFLPSWMDEIHIILPVGDRRKVAQATLTKWMDRDAWIINVTI